MTFIETQAVLRAQTDLSTASSQKAAKPSRDQVAAKAEEAMRMTLQSPAALSNRKDLLQAHMLNTMDAGYRLIAVRPGQKAPIGYRWYERILKRQDIEAGDFDPAMNVGILCGGVDNSDGDPDMTVGHLLVVRRQII